ncbi:MAG: DUF6868 family protein [Cellvibrio sp.]|jgi:hypothetical protein
MMNLDSLCHFLLWSLAVNYTILLTWFFAFAFARDFLRKIHGRWFTLSDHAFDAIHYSGMALYKIAIFIFNLAPLIALCILRGGS